MFVLLGRHVALKTFSSPISPPALRGKDVHAARVDRIQLDRTAVINSLIFDISSCSSTDNLSHPASRIKQIIQLLHTCASS